MSENINGENQHIFILDESSDSVDQHQEQFNQAEDNLDQFIQQINELNSRQINEFTQELNEESLARLIEILNPIQFKNFSNHLNETQLNRCLVISTNKFKDLLQFNVLEDGDEEQDLNNVELHLTNEQYNPNKDYLNLNHIIPNQDLVITNNPVLYPEGYIIGGNSANGNRINQNSIPDYAQFVITSPDNKDIVVYNSEQDFLAALMNHNIVDLTKLEGSTDSGIFTNDISNDEEIIEEKKLYSQQLQSFNNKLSLVRERLMHNQYVTDMMKIQIKDHDLEDEIELKRQEQLIYNTQEHLNIFISFKMQCEEARNRCKQRNKQYPVRFFNDFKDFATKEDCQYLFKIPEEVIDTMPDSFIYFWKTINPDSIQNGKFVFGYEQRTDEYITPLVNSFYDLDFIYKGNKFDTVDLIYLLRKDLIKYLETTLEIDLGDLDYNRNISEQCIEKVMIRLFEGQNLDDLTDEELAKLLKRSQIIINIIPKIKDNKQVIDFQDEIINIILNKQLDSQPLANIKFKLKQLIPNLSNTELNIILMNKLFDKIAIQNININVLINDLINLKTLFPELSSDETLYKQYCINANILIETIFKQKQFKQELLNLNFDSLEQIHNILPKANYDSIFDTVKQSPLFEKSLSNLDFSHLERFFNIVADPDFFSEILVSLIYDNKKFIEAISQLNFEYLEKLLQIEINLDGVIDREYGSIEKQFLDIIINSEEFNNQLLGKNLKNQIQYIENFIQNTNKFFQAIDRYASFANHYIKIIFTNIDPKATNFKQTLQSTIKALETINPNIKNNNDIGNTIVQKIFDSIDFTQNFSEALKLLTETIETIVPEYNLNDTIVKIFINKFYNEPEKLKLFFENKFFVNSLRDHNYNNIEDFVMNKILYNNEEVFKDDEKFKQIIELPFVQQNFGYNENKSLRSYFINLSYSSEKANISDEKLAKLLTLASKKFNFFSNLNERNYDFAITETRSAINFISEARLHQCLLNNICKGTNGEYLEVLFPQNNYFGKKVSEEINIQQLFVAIKEKGAIKNFIKILDESSVLSFYEPTNDYFGKNELKELLRAEINSDKTLLEEALKYPKFFSECKLIYTDIFDEFINELHETGKLNDFLNDIINTNKSYLLPVFELDNPYIINYKLKNINEKIIPQFYEQNEDCNYYRELNDDMKNYNAEKLLLLFKDFANKEIYDFTPLRNYNSDSSSLSYRLQELADYVEDSFSKIEYIIKNSQNSIISLLENLNFENVEPKLLFCIINNLYFLDNNNKEFIIDALKKNQSLNNLSFEYCNDLYNLNNYYNKGYQKNINPIFSNIFHNNLNLQRELKNNITVDVIQEEAALVEQASRRGQSSRRRGQTSRIGQNKKIIKEIIDKIVLNRKENFDIIFESVQSYILEKKDLIHLICNFNDPENLVKTMNIFPNLKNDKMFIEEYTKEILKNKLGQAIFDKINTDDLIKNYIDNTHNNDFSVEVFNKSINDYVNQQVKIFDLGAGTSDMSIKQEMKNSKKQYELRYKNSKIILDDFELNKINAMNDDFERVILHKNTTKTLEDLKK